VAISPGGLVRNVVTKMGSITIDGLDMHRLAWEAYDLSPLYGTPEQRGANRIMPGTPGTIAYAPRITQTRFSLPFLVNGHWDENDDYVSPANVWAQLEANVDFLMGGVLLPTGSGGGTRTVAWTTPSGAVVTSECQVLPAQPPVTVGESAVQITTIELLAPDGDLHL
jgi:hypothetical protein